MPVVAVDILEPGQLVFLDAGSTNLAIAGALPDDTPFTAATNAPTIALALAKRPKIETILIGGRFNPHVGGVLGAEAMRNLNHLSPDVCFLGACAVGPSGDISVFDFEDAAFKRAAAARSRSIVVAATTEKLGISAPFPVLDAHQLTHLCVEANASSESLVCLRRSNVSILSATT